MGYVLLTGATGLVGRHVLRDLLRRDVRVAAMVRPGKGPTTLAGILSHWEDEAGHMLPRPVVIEGDLCLANVVPDARQRRWLHRHAKAIVHCAASMTFREDRRGEPFRTNVGGTEHLLALCRELAIRRFHHVSTAYICGLRQGRILESEIDVGQELGNVYEQSKLQAEKLIRGAAFLDECTFYRPASVLGDSRTGYVTNFHGFYLPLQLAHVMAGYVPVHEMSERFFGRLGLKGNEGKNLVPVDWLAEAIAYLVTHPEHHGRTYHLASPRPVPVAEVQRVVRDAIERHYPKPLATSISSQELDALESKFYDYMLIYRSHWRDDPQFDLANTRAALSHLPCPDMTYDLLMREARFPVERNFVPPRHVPPAPACDVAAHLAARFAATGETVDAIGDVGLEVNGAGGGQWTLQLEGDRVVGVEAGLPDPMRACLYLGAAAFGDLANGNGTVENAIRCGRLVVEGTDENANYWNDIVRQVVGDCGNVPDARTGSDNVTRFPAVRR